MNVWLYFMGHLLIAAAVFVIAYKSEHPQSWLAFVPVANLWLMLDMADLPIWMIVLFFIPVAGIIAYVWVWMKIAENTNKSEWLGLSMIIPVVNVNYSPIPGFL